jgi:hypothetical protein
LSVSKHEEDGMDVGHVIQLGRQLTTTTANTGVWIETAAEELREQGVEPAVFVDVWARDSARLTDEARRLDGLMTSPEEAEQCRQDRTLMLQELALSIQHLSVAIAHSLPDHIESSGQPGPGEVPEPVAMALQCLATLRTETEHLVHLLSSGELVSRRHWADRLSEGVDTVSSRFAAAQLSAVSTHRALEPSIADLRAESRQRQRFESLAQRMDRVTTSMAGIASLQMDDRSSAAGRLADRLAGAAIACGEISGHADEFLHDNPAVKWQVHGYHPENARPLLQFANETLKPLWVYVQERLPQTVALRDDRWPLDPGDDSAMRS